MWIVQVALRRPYTFLVMALLILLATPLVLLKMSIDIFPEINIPVISIVWNYSGLSAQEIGQRITADQRAQSHDHGQRHRAHRIASPGRSFDHQGFLPAERQHADRHRPDGGGRAIAIAQLPPGILPPQVIKYSASAIPVIQLGLSSPTMTEQAVFDAAVNFLRPRLVTIPGVADTLAVRRKERV